MVVKTQVPPRYLKESDSLKGDPLQDKIISDDNPRSGGPVLRNYLLPVDFRQKDRTPALKKK